MRQWHVPLKGGEKVGMRQAGMDTRSVYNDMRLFYLFRTNSGMNSLTAY